MAKDRVYEGTSRTFALRSGYMKYVEGIKIVLLTHMYVEPQNLSIDENLTL